VLHCGRSRRILDSCLIRSLRRTEWLFLLFPSDLILSKSDVNPRFLFLPVEPARHEDILVMKGENDLLDSKICLLCDA